MKKTLETAKKNKEGFEQQDVEKERLRISGDYELALNLKQTAQDALDEFLEGKDVKSLSQADADLYKTF